MARYSSSFECFLRLASHNFVAERNGLGESAAAAAVAVAVLLVHTHTHFPTEFNSF